MTTFEEALAYLKDLTKFGFNLGLERITELLHRLDDPHVKERPAYIHIGGTNGKGSTSVMVARVLEAAGYRVGLFTSPHMHCYTERTQINGKSITQGDVAQLIDQFRPHLDAMVAEGYEHPTEFEVWTALSFMYFAHQAADIVVLEVGLGGSIDSTNVVNPIVTCITNVSMDHMDYLGHTLRDIAAVKAGIIKPGVPLITASENSDVLQVLSSTAEAVGAPLVQVAAQERDLSHTLMNQCHKVIWEPVEGGKEMVIHGRIGHYGPLMPPLAGKHQQANLATAVALLETVLQKGFLWEEKHLQEGLGRVTWPGRQERFGQFLLDGAHNVAGAQTLAQTLKEDYPDWNKVLLIGMLADKEREKVVELLAPLAQTVIVTRPNNPRSGDWEQLAANVSRYCSQVQVMPDVRDAVDQAWSEAQQLKGYSDKTLIVVTGSLYMVAEAREYIRQKC
ncbi:bifunctional folylpolyglutamate synthase/dihydrofolate synthase [Heliobacillus mobilis]|uniref:tetrahydrofolate synthase n=1 Tax=Heliobacterium mobile TaxID=28064 RepID=A0A6I3SGV1_HELMO|nr:folylpolyglutamate synthase/dihydrofolate synthase family protein [Heliobacterium mobile]MTV48063.1 bifunctional folylpolyglutamate synthase/dihydrofolate synthase [Heliobacterium mobile]